MRAKRFAGFTLILLLIVALLQIPGNSFEGELIGQILKTNRDCFVTERGTGNWIKAVNGVNIKSGSKLKTGDKSTMIIKLKRNLIKLGPMTEIELSDFTSVESNGDSVWERDSTSTIIGLVMGKVYGSVKNLTDGSVFEIRTDISIAGVRGTVFSVERMGENSFSTAVVLWGIVSFSSIDPKTGSPIGSSVDVGRKEFSTIESGMPASPADKAPNKLIRAISTANNDMIRTLESLNSGDFRGSGGIGGTSP